MISTAALSWQIYSYWHSRRSRIEVQLKNAFLTYTDGSPRQVVAINVINNSDHAVRVSSLGLDLQDRSGRTAQAFQQIPGATLPGQVERHDSGETYLLADELKRDGFDLSRPLRGWATLSTGKTVRSKPVQLEASK